MRLPERGRVIPEVSILLTGGGGTGGMVESRRPRFVAVHQKFRSALHDHGLRGRRICKIMESQPDNTRTRQRQS